MKELVFLKLGGSLITDKTQPYTPRLDVIEDVALQISTALQNQPNLRLILGHGSGSFGHVAASEYQTRAGFPRPSPLIHRERDKTEENYWKGFAEVWYQASSLNRYVMKALHKTNVQAVALPPLANIIASDGQVSIWETTSIRMALAAGIVPVIYGDVTFDEVRGGTILSIEDLFSHLARALNPERILLAGLESSVSEESPAQTDQIETTEAKVTKMQELVQQNPELRIQIFSGAEPGNIMRALAGETLGRWMSA